MQQLNYVVILFTSTLIWSTPILASFTYALILHIIPTQDQHQSSNPLHWTGEQLVCFMFRKGLWQSSCTPCLVSNPKLLAQIQQNHTTLMDTTMRYSYTSSNNLVEVTILKQCPVCQLQQGYWYVDKRVTSCFHITLTLSLVCTLWLNTKDSERCE